MVCKRWIITMIVLTTLQVAFNDSSLSQGLYLNKGESGFGFEGAYGWSKDVSGISGAIGYSHKGLLDLVLTAANLGPQDSNLEVNSYGLFVQLHFLKNDKMGKISAAMGAGYSRNYTSERSADYQKDLFAWTVMFYGKEQLTTKLKISPAFSLSYIFPIGDGPGIRFFNANVGVSFGVTMNHSLFYISTSVSKPFRSLSQMGEISFLVGLGLLYSPS